MKSKSNGTAPERDSGLPPITELWIEGFKSFGTKQTIAIRPLTVLAGANSSGKSSAIQPLLMLKQTLESRFDAGPVKIDGPNVQFTSIDQLLTKRGGSRTREFQVGVRAERRFFETTIGFSSNVKAAYIKESAVTIDDESGAALRVHSNAGGEVLDCEIEGALIGDLFHVQPKERAKDIQLEWETERTSFLLLPVSVSGSFKPPKPTAWRFQRNSVRGSSAIRTPLENATPESLPLRQVRDLIHVPGWRGSPARIYPVASLNSGIPGLFIDYFASVILDWQETGNPLLYLLKSHLASLALSTDIRAAKVGDVGIELSVSRTTMARSAKRVPRSELVSIADVGLGVQNILPALVALLLAEPGRVVYIEQPEIHLHPRAQVELGGILIEAAKRGVRVVVETHSDLLLRVLQTSIARGGDDGIDKGDVALHWFSRDPKTGDTKVTTAELADNGSFGEWPEDFGDVYLEAEGAFLDAAQARNLAESEG